MRISLILAVALGGLLNATVWAQSGLQCPGPLSKLSCELNTTFKTSNSSLSAISPTTAAQLSQLPLATAATGSGLVFSGGIPTVSTDTLGSILTERGYTIGKHKFYVAFNYQRFWFDTIDGIDLKNFPGALRKTGLNSTGGYTYVVSTNRIDLLTDQFTVLGTFGLTDRLDVTLVVPFSKVTLKTQLKKGSFDFNSDSTDIFVGSPAPDHPYNAGSASGIGDVLVNVKANVLKLEKNNLAVGAEVRFPTGDEFNFLGSGAYGFKPYVVFSHTGRITPHANLAYQWNGVSALYPNQDYRPNEDINAPVGSSNGKLNLPGSLQYSAGADLRVTKKVTLVGDLIGQHVFSGVRLLVGTRKVQTPSGNTPPSDQAPPQCDKTQWTCPTILSTPGSYNMNSFGIGVKWNPVGGLLIFGNALIKLDDAGLRANVVPLAGVSYRF